MGVRLTGNGGWAFLLQLLSVIAILAGGILWIDSSIDGVADDLISVKIGVMGMFEEVDERIDDAIADRWKGAHQRLWAHRLRERNRDLSVPDPDTVRRDCARNDRVGG